LAASTTEYRWSGESIRSMSFIWFVLVTQIALDRRVIRVPVAHSIPSFVRRYCRPLLHYTCFL
jgi:hypothetical protein